MPFSKKVHRPRKNKLLAHAGDALLIIDVINDLEFPGGEKLQRKS